MIGARFALNVPRAWKSFQAHLMVLRVDVGQVEARFGLFGDNTKLNARYMCTVCAECTIGSEITLSAPEGTPC
jgi:hypothetical protein